MPTDRPRLTITETDDVARMLDDAGVHWPEHRDQRARLLKLLAQRGAEAVRYEQATRAADWIAVVRNAAGAAGPDAYPPDYLERLRGDWPA